MNAAQRVLGLAILCLCCALAGAELRSNGSKSTIDWEQLLRSAREQHPQDATTATERWQALLLQLKDAPVAEQLREVNRFFNAAVNWRADEQVWGERDYWATPLEMLARAQGDCEDYSIAKYISLVHLGVPVQRLRITYVRAQQPGSTAPIAHMVLAYYPSEDAEPLVLDNIAIDILPASRRTDLTPVFGFNSAGIWVSGQRNPSSTEPVARLSRWRDLLQRMANEGINLH